MKFLTDLIDVGTLVPDNATNGDIVKALFPNENYLFEQTSACTYYGIKTRFDTDWWNSPYMAESEESTDD